MTPRVSSKGKRWPCVLAFGLWDGINAGRVVHARPTKFLGLLMDLGFVRSRRDLAKPKSINRPKNFVGLACTTRLALIRSLRQKARTHGQRLPSESSSM